MPYVCQSLRRPEEGIGTPGNRVTNDCALPGVGAGNQPWFSARIANAFSL